MKRFDPDAGTESGLDPEYAAALQADFVFMVMESWGLGPGAWGLGPGAWGLGPGAWGLGPGAWGLGPGAWGLGPGAWGLGPGAWGLGPGAWGLPPDKIRRVDEIRERYGSIGASRYRIDMVSFSLETRHGLWFAQAPLKRKGASKKRRTFGLIKFKHFDDVEGRFADLLGTQPADAEGTGPLH